MDVTKILAELRQERIQIEEAIVSLERLARGRGRRRGRPPAWLAEPPRSLGFSAEGVLIESSAVLPTMRTLMGFTIYDLRFMICDLKTSGGGR